jgi:RNA polymerase primary sigma factor
VRQLTIIKQITNRETKSLDKYLTEIGRVDLLTIEEEVQLVARIDTGDEIAIQKLASANLRFVVSVAKQYQNNGLPLGDLINEGNVGLIKAASRFDATRGFKFISYAVWWIRQTILQALAENARVVRLPMNRVSELSKLSKAFSLLEQKFQREPSHEELGETLGLSEKEVTDAYRISGKHLSLDAPFVHGEQNNLLDTLTDNNASPEANLLTDSLRSEVSRMLATLTSRESDVIRHYYGLSGAENLTLAEIGTKLNISTERVRQIREKATRRLRHPSRSKILKTYLG